MHSSYLVAPTARIVHGVLLLNKPMGLTSQQAVSKVKGIFNSKKAGHTGSLDPIATGLLPVCLGEATKFSQFLLSADKHYRVEAKLGERTDTGDATGNIIEQKSVSLLPIHQIQEALSHFLGKLLQAPPMFSALKHKGKPLYHWARQGITVKKEARPVTIYSLKLLAYSMNQLTLEVRCSKGTYIRTLIDDLGNVLGCGMHVTNLCRLSVGKYSIEDSIDLHTLESLDTIEERIQKVLPLETILPSEWPALMVSEPAAFYLRRGQALNLPNTPKADRIKLLLKTDNRLFGLGQTLKDGRIAPYRLIETIK